jgi:hypothetical protein
MKIITDSFPTRVLLLVFFILVVVSQLAPLESNSIIPNQADLFNHVAAIIQATMELTDYQFPLRIAPMQFKGWSYPFFQFYAPTSYVYAAFIYKYLTPMNPYAAYKLTIGSALIFGAIYLYRLAYWLTKSYPAAILASVVFLTAPYFNILIGALGAFNEIIAISLVPFVLYYTLRDYWDPSNIKYLLLVSLGWYVLITTHIITFIFSASLIGILLFILTCKNKQWKQLIRAGIAVLFSCAMASWFLAPDIFFSHYFSVSSSFPDAESVFSASPNLASILSPTLNKIMNMEQNVVTRAHSALGLPIIMGVGIAIYAICMNGMRKNNNGEIKARSRSDDYIFPFIIIFLIAFILLWSPINYWSWLPPSFLVIQYTMRMLAQLIWIGPLIFAWAICWLFNSKLDVRHTAIGVLLIFAATNSVLPTLANGPYTIKDITENPVLRFNPDAYIINPIQSSNLVTQIDNYQLDTLVLNHKLVLDAPFYMPLTLLNLAKNPEIIMEGYVLNKNKQHSYRLEMKMDKQVIATLPLQKTGKLTWKIPLSQAITKINKDLLPIEFSLTDVKTNDTKSISGISIQADKIELIGFLNPLQTIDITELQSQCMYLKSELLCNVSVSSGVNLVELPMFYYPEMLKVTLNGKQVSYQGILRNDKLIVGVVPVPGVSNVIKAKFVGLPWANVASMISWGLWILIFLWGIFQPNRHHAM